MSAMMTSDSLTRLRYGAVPPLRVASRRTLGRRAFRSGKMPCSGVWVGWVGGGRGKMPAEMRAHSQARHVEQQELLNRLRGVNERRRKSGAAQAKPGPVELTMSSSLVLPSSYFRLHGRRG